MSKLFRRDFASDEEYEQALYEITHRRGEERFGSPCDHKQTQGGKCLNCLRTVVTRIPQSTLRVRRRHAYEAGAFTGGERKV